MSAFLGHLQIGRARDPKSNTRRSNDDEIHVYKWDIL